jgi:hypothetical protein
MLLILQPARVLANHSKYIYRFLEDFTPDQFTLFL